jgi:hypothetical protein
MPVFREMAESTAIYLQEGIQSPFEETQQVHNFSTTATIILHQFAQHALLEGGAQSVWVAEPCQQQELLRSHKMESHMSLIRLRWQMANWQW